MIENNINKSKIIEDVTEQTAMQPWVDMEFVQLGRGSHVGLLESVDLKTQQLVRERQHVAVQKLGVTPPTCARYRAVRRTRLSAFPNVVRGALTPFFSSGKH